MNITKTLVFSAAILLSCMGLSAQTFTNYTTSDGLISDNVSCVAVDANDEVWFGTGDGVSHFDGTNWTNYDMSTDSGIVDNGIEAVAVASNGDVWIGTSFGVSVYDGTTWTGYTSADGLGNEQIKYIAEGQSGKIWFATISGLSSWDGSSWTNFGTSDGIPFGGINHIEVAANGNLWLGSGLSGELIYDGSTFSVINTTNGLISDKIRSTAIDAQDNKWIGTERGISVLDASNAVTAYHSRIFTLPGSDTLNPVEDIEIDSRGLVWVGVYVDYLVTEGGVSLWDGSQWTQFEMADGLVGPVVRRLAIDSQDNVWVATSTGVSRISGVTVNATAITEEDPFKMFPNPATDRVNLEFSRESSLKATTLELYNVSMQQVFSMDIRRGQVSAGFSLTDLEAGMYFLKMGNHVEKLIKQ